MTTQEIQRIKAKQPFEPFRVLVADGKEYHVRHPENFMLTGNGRLIAIAQNDHFITLDLLLITGVQSPIPPRRNGRKKSK